MKIEIREIVESDLQRISSAFDDRVARYKARGVWSPIFNQIPLPFFHNGRICCDADTGAVFTQIPYHPTQVGNEKSLVLLEGGLVVIQAHGFPQHSIQFVSRNLWSRLAYVTAFAIESFAQSGNWAFPTQEGATFYVEASALTL